jgi:MerR family mercuric resistance operon transcriptional regulator
MRDLTIGKAAGEAGVKTATLRFYERCGLIEQPPKPGTGYRIYPPGTVDRIRFIRQAQEIGFSLAEIGDLLSLRAAPETDCSKVRDRAQAKLAEVDRKMARLRKIRGALERLVAACPGEAAALEECSILQSLEDTQTTPAKAEKRKETGK